MVHRSLGRSTPFLGSSVAYRFPPAWHRFQSRTASSKSHFREDQITSGGGEKYPRNRGHGYTRDNQAFRETTRSQRSGSNQEAH
jgi:hypothetical protein